MDEKKLLGSISPLYGITTGHGVFGKLATSGGLPGVVYDAITKKKKKDGTPMTPAEEAAEAQTTPGMKKGGAVKKMASGGSASKRADGCAIRGKTRGKLK